MSVDVFEITFNVFIHVDNGSVLVKTATIPEKDKGDFITLMFNNLRSCEEYFLFVSNNNSHVLIPKNRIVAMEISPHN